MNGAGARLPLSFLSSPMHQQGQSSMSKYFPDSNDYGHHTIFGNVPVKTYAGEQIQLSYVEMPPDGVVDWHSHINEQMGLVITGKALFQIDDEERILGPGDMYRIPGGIRHRVTPVEAPTKIIDVFYPVRDEYR
jgi:quercetin dioxygenase-like cupin family protein